MRLKRLLFHEEDGVPSEAAMPLPPLQSVLAKAANCGAINLDRPDHCRRNHFRNHSAATWPLSCGRAG